MDVNVSDEELVVKAKTDMSAVSELIARYMCAVEVLAKKISPDVSDDLKQEGLMALLKAVQTYRADKEASFATYASVCIRNRMLSSLRKNSLSEAADIAAISDDELDDYTVGSDVDIPENIVIERERMDELYGRISSKLSQQEWQVFQLFLTGMSYNSIGSKLGLSVKAVDNAMQRVRRKLKSLLK